MTYFDQMCLAVRQFMSALGQKTYLGAMPTLYLEFPDVASMREAELAIMRELSTADQPRQHKAEFLDDETLKFEAYAGVSIVLTCKQRFALRDWRKTGYKTAGYRNITFVEAKPLKDSGKLK